MADNRRGREVPADSAKVGAQAAEPVREIQKAGRYRVYFRFYEKAIFKDVFVEVGVPESIVVETAKDAIKDSLELIRYVPLEEPEEDSGEAG
jgi:hypothetical protein